MSADEWGHVNVPDQDMEPDDETDDERDECTCRRRDCDDCGTGPDDARDYDD